MRPRSADTSEPACVKRKMLSTKNEHVLPWSRKYSATVRPASATRARAPGGSFIWPYTSATFVENARLLDLEIEVVAFTGALADAGEHRVSAVALGDVVDQLLNETVLPTPAPPKRPILPPLHERGEQVDDLDAGDEDLRLGRLVDIFRGRLVDGAALLRPHRAGLVYRLADDVHDAAERLLAHRNRDRLAGVGDLLVADEALGGVHGDGADRVLAEMLGDL
jgi:hypothetical protein